MLPWSINTQGRFEEIKFDSHVLQNNPLGDPHKRPLWIYLPPGYDKNLTAIIPPFIKYRALLVSWICGVIALHLERTIPN
jgi:hypothetical protein